MALGLILICVTLGAFGQLCLKKGVGSEHLKGLLGILGAFRSPYVIVGFLAYGISSLLWLAVLSRTDLSFAYPLVSISYLLTVLGAAVIFREDVSLMRWAGVLLICAGIAFMVRSGS